MFKEHDVHMMLINAEILSNTQFKNYKLVSELVGSLFLGYDKLTLITNYVDMPSDIESLSEGYLIFKINTKDIRENYVLDDFHAAVVAHLASHQLLLESLELRKKELIRAKLSKAFNHLEELKLIINDCDSLIKMSELMLNNYREDMVLRFGFLK